MKALLCSEVISALGNPKKSILGYCGGKIADAKINQLRSDLVFAKKFSFSDDFLKKVAHASFEKPSVLLDMCDSAIPPFDNIWIEWDESLRHKIHEDYHGENVYLKSYKDIGGLGYHIKSFQDDLGDRYFLYQAYFKHDKWKKIASQPMCFTLNNFTNDMSYEDYQAKQELLAEIPSYMQAKDEKQWNNTVFEVGSKLMAHWYIMQYIPKKVLNKHAQVNKDGDGTFMVDADVALELKNYNNSYEWNCLYELFERMGSCQGAPMHWSIPSHKFEEGYTLDEMRKFNDAFLSSCEGDARFIISALGLMNMSIHESVNVQPDNKIIHTYNGKRVPRNDYKVLNINLTDKQVRKIYKTKFTGQGSAKRKHERRGHWRHYRDATGVIIRKVWIKSCTAGNKNLGTISKDYNLK